MVHQKFHFLCGIVSTITVSLLVASHADAQKKDDLPEVESLYLNTRDGVRLNAYYYASKEGKQAPPIILLHDWEGSSKDFMNEKGLAKYLQSNGYAVIVPDFRGHGKSLEMVGTDETIDRDKFRNADFASMTLDIEACKKHLMKENNQGKLNIELLSVLAIGKSTLLATTWAVSDWSFPPLRGVKQGQDVKAVMMISPTARFKGLSQRTILKAPVFSGKSGSAIPVYLLAGDNDSTVKGDVRKIETQLKRTRGKELSKESLVVTLGTNRQGAEFGNFGRTQKMIDQFVKMKVLSKADELRWQNRNQ